MRRGKLVNKNKNRKMPQKIAEGGLKAALDELEKQISTTTSLKEKSKLKTVVRVGKYFLQSGPIDFSSNLICIYGL